MGAIVEGWVNIEQAAAASGYNARHVRLLAGRGRVPCQKVGPVWLIDRGGLLAYKARMDALGKSKYDPWRRDLADQGRGRRRDAG